MLVKITSSEIAVVENLYVDSWIPVQEVEREIPIYPTKKWCIKSLTDSNGV